MAPPSPSFLPPSLERCCAFFALLLLPLLLLPLPASWLEALALTSFSLSISSLFLPFQTHLRSHLALLHPLFLFLSFFRLTLVFSFCQSWLLQTQSGQPFQMYGDFLLQDGLLAASVLLLLTSSLLPYFAKGVLQTLHALTPPPETPASSPAEQEEQLLYSSQLFTLRGMLLEGALTFLILFSAFWLLPTSSLSPLMGATLFFQLSWAASLFGMSQVTHRIPREQEGFSSPDPKGLSLAPQVYLVSTGTSLAMAFTPSDLKGSMLLLLMLVGFATALIWPQAFQVSEDK